MAGNFAMMPVLEETKASMVSRGQWKVQFSRFFCYPSPAASNFPDLVPLPRYLRDRGSFGTWLSASTPAQLRLAVNPSGAGADAVLDVSLGGELMEEHYVLKLHFSWPQVKCVSGFPERGSRALFVSYRDSTAENQKFAVRFSTICETEAFINVLKDIFKGETDVKPFRSEHKPAMNDFMSPRASEFMRPMNTIVDYSPEMPSSLIYRAEQPPLTQETMPVTKFESNFASLPPSFTSLLTDYCPIAEEVAGYPIAPEEDALKSQIAKYMEDASFHDMLIKVEKVISDMGGGEYAM